MSEESPQLQPYKLAKLSPNVRKLVDTAKELYLTKLSDVVGNHHPPAFIVAAPGRVNLIGEHTDYSGGFCFPLAIDKHTLIYGTGFVHSGKGSSPTQGRIRVCSSACPDDLVEERKLVVPFDAPTTEDPLEPSWVNYVIGVVAQYLPDLPPEGYHLDLAMAFATDIPLGAGLSSSAALEVATATFLEHYLKEAAYSSATSSTNLDIKIQRALRCQKAENDWAASPCGIMDQIASSCAQEGNLMLIDCKSLEVTQTLMKSNVATPAILVANSKTQHSIADGEYGTRRRECNDALEAMQQVPLYHVMTLRDANLKDCQMAESKMV
jgi:galactokinase